MKNNELMKKEIKMLIALDKIRDEESKPFEMLPNMVEYIRKEINVNALMLFVRDETYNDSKIYFSFKNNKKKQNFPIFMTHFSENDIAAKTIKTLNKILYITPIELNGEILGSIGVIFEKTDDKKSIINLLNTAINQIDSAINQSKRIRNVINKNDIIRIIYKIDSIRDKHSPFNEMMNEIASVIKKSIKCDNTFITIYNSFEKEFIIQSLMGYKSKVSEKDILDFSQIVAKKQGISQRMINGREYAGIPLILENNIIGIIGCSSITQKINSHHKAILKAVASQADTAIFESMEKKRLRDVLGRSVDPKIMSKLLLNEETQFLDGEKMNITVLFADIRGSTELSENISPTELVRFINKYLKAMTNAIFNNNGTVDKFVGDEVMALFGAPFKQRNKELLAVKAAIDMQNAYMALVSKWNNEFVEKTTIGIGISTGEIIAGEMGYEKRTDYTIIGKTANIGARICSSAKPEEILIDNNTYQIIMKKYKTDYCGLKAFKGIKGKEKIFSIVY